MGVVASRISLALILAGAAVGGCQGTSVREAPAASRAAMRDPLADGKVIRTDLVNGLAYITLGKADHLQPGMTFNSFDPRIALNIPVVCGYAADRIPSERQSSPIIGRVTGSLEVLQVLETYSVCRITQGDSRTRVQAGDLISNAACHATRNRSPHFVIDGTFDLNGDGIPTADERDRLT
ncbi:MAG TPA: hypothetical protein VHM90_02950, partial [Phycisphaerae bacterium]|nr:hypothetical protein [Phycisphaerae bacterium]